MCRHTNHNPVFFVQTCIAKHESNGIDIIIALIVNPINPLGKHRLDLVLELKVSKQVSGTNPGRPLALKVSHCHSHYYINTYNSPQCSICIDFGCWEQDILTVLLNPQGFFKQEQVLCLFFLTMWWTVWIVFYNLTGETLCCRTMPPSSFWPSWRAAMTVRMQRRSSTRWDPLNWWVSM